VSNEPDIDLIEQIDIFRRAKEKIGKVDDKMLLWLLRSTVLLDVPVFSYQSALVDELEDRLFPGYDGDTVRLEDFGWSTPDGLIIYTDSFCTCECHRRQNIVHANPCCAKCPYCFRHFKHDAYAKHDGKCSRQPGDQTK
jgi:hypothetical protein